MCVSVCVCVSVSVSLCPCVCVSVSLCLCMCVQLMYPYTLLPYMLEKCCKSRRVSSLVEHSSANPKVTSAVQFRDRSHTRVMDYDEACIMHLTPGVVHNFPKAVGV